MKNVAADPIFAENRHYWTCLIVSVPSGGANDLRGWAQSLRTTARRRTLGCGWIPRLIGGILPEGDKEKP